MNSGYILYLETDKSIQYEFNKTSGKSGLQTTSTKKNVSRVSLNTFGKVPYVYYAGEMNYATFDLSTVFLAVYDDAGTKILTAREHADKFIAMVDKHKPIVVEDSQKRKFICDVQITNETTPTLYENDSMEYVEISISCTQIDFDKIY